MADDTFFGHHATLPGDDEGGGGNGRFERGPCHEEEQEELEYDALNDETFGSAINNDWEDLHETFVEQERFGASGDPPKNTSMRNTSRFMSDDPTSASNNEYRDLELNLSRMGINDVQVESNYGDDEDLDGRINLDYSVWSAPIKPNRESTSLMPPNFNHQFNHNNMMGGPSQQMMTNQMPPFPPQPAFNRIPPMGPPALSNEGPKMCTLEDIERNIRNQQQEANNINNNSNINSNIHNGTMPPRQTFQSPVPGQHIPPPQRLPPPGFGPIPVQATPPGLTADGMPFPMKMPLGFSSTAHNQSPQRLHSQQQQPPQHQMMNSNHFNKRLVMEIQQTHPMLCYNRMNPAQPPPVGMGPPQQPMHPMMHNLPHPMQMHHQGHGQPPFLIANGNGGMPKGQSPNAMGHLLGTPLYMMHKEAENQQMMHQQQQQQQPLQQKQNYNNSLHNPNQLQQGSLDEYANLMSQRDKQWLIGIQLMQLNTEAPYIDDYYYTVYRERRMNGRRENRIHKDNQLNHPFAQAQSSHVQLVLQSIGNKNKPGQKQHHHHQRERHTSESRNGGENGTDGNTTSRPSYIPLQFENSLGKLQCGSVTAPRKIIDMEVMGTDPVSASPGGAVSAAVVSTTAATTTPVVVPTSNTTTASSLELSAQRKSRHLLLQIETMYKLVLKVEDLKNPTAIEAASVLKEKRERERKLAMEQQNNAGATELGTQFSLGAILSEKAASSTAAVTEEEGKEETIDDLLVQLINGLASDIVTAMMGVRKGKTLLRRTLPHLLVSTYSTSRWRIWCAILVAFPMVLKKDRDDSEGHLDNLCELLRVQLMFADLNHIADLGQAICYGSASSTNGGVITSSYNKSSIASFVGCKIGVETIILLIQQAEYVFVRTSKIMAKEDREAWLVFLIGLTTYAANESGIDGRAVAANTTARSEPKVADEDIKKVSIRHHLSRFEEVPEASAGALITILQRHMEIQ